MTVLFEYNHSAEIFSFSHTGLNDVASDTKNGRLVCLLILEMRRYGGEEKIGSRSLSQVLEGHIRI